MLFEKLEYTVKNKEYMEKQLRQELDDKYEIYNKEVIDAAHTEELRKFFSLISDMKSLYAHKLEEYRK